MTDLKFQEPTEQDKTMALIAHLGGFFTSIVLPLVLYLNVKRHPDDLPTFTELHAREALNYQISLFFQAGFLGVPSVVLLLFIKTFPPAVLLISSCMIVLLAFVMVGLEILFITLASIKAKQGELYRYPLTLRFV